MSNTPNLGLPYPELTDTADVPRDIKALADKLDALLGGGGGGGGSGTLPLQAAPVLDVGLPGQIRAGRQLSGADFTALGLSAPIGLWSLSDLTNQGSDGRPLVNLGAVPFGVGINGAASTAAVFAGSTGQALYIVDSGAADPLRIRTGTIGCWFRTAKSGTTQWAMSKAVGAQNAFWLGVLSSNLPIAQISTTGADAANVVGVTNITDNRWHFVVATVDGTMLRLYVDGVLEAAAPAALMFTGTAPFNVGANGADGSTAAAGPFYGRVDEAFVTADVLTHDQVRLLYACRLSHTLATIPTTARLKVHRRRRGAAFAVADFPTQPIRLHNFTGGALTDQGSGAVALVNNGGALSIAGADGTPADGFNFNGANNQTLSATDAGLPGGLTARSYGCWFNTTNVGAITVMGWGTLSTGDARILLQGGAVQLWSGPDSIGGPSAADGQWHFVVGVEDNTAGDGVRRKLYLDGRLVGGSTVLTAITLAGANALRIGGSPPAGAAPFTGQIDGAFVCGYALTHDQIAALFAKGTQDLGGSPKNAGDHVERVDATSLLFIADTLESQHTVDLGVVA